MKKKVPSEQEIAKKHGVSVEAIIKQAEIGSTVEREHVTTHEEAYGIALQHLDEFPDYYKHLLKMEKELKSQHRKKTVKEMRQICETHIALAAGRELDDEGSMILNQLDEIEMHCRRMREVVKSPTMQIPAWVQSKVTLATDYMDAATNYMSSKNEEYVAEVAEKRYCPKCKKTETKSECSYGPDYWEQNAKKSLGESAWTRKAGKNKNGGLNEKGRKSYERENPGSDLKAPSKKVGNPRRKSFCARMKGMKAKLTSKKTASDPDSRINKSLRAWNC